MDREALYPKVSGTKSELSAVFHLDEEPMYHLLRLFDFVFKFKLGCCYQRIANSMSTSCIYIALESSRFLIGFRCHISMIFAHKLLELDYDPHNRKKLSRLALSLNHYALETRIKFAEASLKFDADDPLYYLISLATFGFRYVCLVLFQMLNEVVLDDLKLSIFVSLFFNFAPDFASLLMVELEDRFLWIYASSLFHDALNSFELLLLLLNGFLSIFSLLFLQLCHFTQELIF